MSIPMRPNLSEQAKVGGDYFLSGFLDAWAGTPAYYGAHYGMKSDRDAAVKAYYRGHEVGTGIKRHETRWQGVSATNVVEV